MDIYLILGIWSTLLCTRFYTYILPKSCHITYIIRERTGINFHHAHFTPFIIILIIITLIYKLYILANIMVGISISLTLDQPYRTIPILFKWLYRYKYWGWQTVGIVISLHMLITLIIIYIKKNYVK